MYKYKTDKYRDLDYLAFIEEISTKLSLQHEQIKDLQASIPSLKADLAELQTECEILITEKRDIDTKRSSLQNAIQDLETEEKSVQHELGADLTKSRLKPVDISTRVWLLLKQGAVKDEIETVELERDDLLIDRELIKDKQQIVQEGIELYEDDITRSCARLVALQKEKHLTRGEYRRGVKKYELNCDQELSAC